MQIRLNDYVLHAVQAVIVAAFALTPACERVTTNPGEDPPGVGDPDAAPLPPPPANCEDGVPAPQITDGTPPDAPKVSCEGAVFCDKFSPGYTIDEEAKSAANLMLGSMSLSDKAAQMRGTSPAGGNNYTDIFRTPNDDNQGIRGWLFRDGPNGVNLAAELQSGQDGYATAFPSPVARAATFDLGLENRIGIAMGDETVASGNTMMLAPAVNILRHPAWGRAQEIYGEDPFVLGRMGTAYVAGVQQFVPACVKHFAANNIENGRGSANATMDEQTLREMYTRQYDMIINDGGVACVMAAYNLVNGVKMTQNSHLLDEVLRGDFGFEGLVLSDWWAMPPGTAGASTDALQANASQAIVAGMDMELPWSYNYEHIEAITGPGRPVDEALITASARRILEQKFRFKVARMGESIGLRTPTTNMTAKRSIENNAAHIALAQEAAIKGMVLLKNDGATLPIQRGSVSTIAVIGAEVPYHVVNTDNANGVIRFATDPRLGDLGSGRVFADPAKSSGPAAGIREIAGGGINVVSGSDPALADGADFVVVVAGLTPEDEGEEYTGAGDRPNFSLDGKRASNAQNELIAAVAAKNKPMTVVLMGGSVIDMPWLGDVPAVVMAWYPGMDGGRALGKLLFGDRSFSGKLPISWARQWDDLPPLNQGTTTPFDYFLGYRYFDDRGIAPLFPFGHGLSYTAFEYSNLYVPCSDVTKNGVVDVTVDITNTGSVAGDEVAFLFASYPNTTARRPDKELKGFNRVSLEPGQTKRVTFRLRVADLKYWNTGANRWEVESGPVTLRVGSSAAALPLEDTLVVN